MATPVAVRCHLPAVEDDFDRRQGERDPPDDSLAGGDKVWRHGATVPFVVRTSPPVHAGDGVCFRFSQNHSLECIDLELNRQRHEQAKAAEGRD